MRKRNIKSYICVLIMTQRDNAACLDALQGFVDQSIVPLVYQGLVSMKQQAVEISQSNGNSIDTKTVLRELLGEVKNWTQVLLEEECRRIERVVPFLQKLLTALFIMKVKVLSCINMRKNNDEFPLTIPSNNTFIHHVYIQMALQVSNNIEVIDDPSYVVLCPLIINAIRAAEFECLRWNDLLEWGLADVNPTQVLNDMMNAPDNIETPTSPTPIPADESDLTALANEEKTMDDDDGTRYIGDGEASSFEDSVPKSNNNLDTTPTSPIHEDNHNIDGAADVQNNNAINK